MFARNASLCLLLAALAAAPATGDEGPSREKDPYPLGESLAVLERDLSSRDYAAVLETMIPTDLEAEWKRVATADNHATFLKAQGGRDKVLAQPALKAAYERRLSIANGFLDLMRAAYKKRGLAPPFDNGEEIDLLAAGRAGDLAPLDEALVRVVMPAPGAERNWPRLRGPTGQGHAVDADFPLEWSTSENIVYKVEVPGRGNSSPVIWNNHLFLTTASEDGRVRSLLCYARETGELLWKEDLPEASVQEQLYWKNTYASSTPVTDGRLVIGFYGNAGLACHDFEGRRVWHEILGTFPTTHGPGASPVLYRDRVFLIQDQNQGQPLCAAYDKQTGRRLWQRERPKDMCWSTPVVLRVGDHDELVHNGSHVVTGYNPENGETLWQVSGTSRESIPMLVAGGGLIYSFSGRNGPILAIRPGGQGDVTETHIAWQLPRGGPHVPSPVFHDGRLYFANDTGIATCLDARSGETLWQTRLRGRFSMSPIEAAGRILLTGETGTTWVLEAGPTYKELAVNDLEQDVLATPAVLGGRIYFRTKSHLVCVGRE